MREFGEIRKVSLSCAPRRGVQGDGARDGVHEMLSSLWLVFDKRQRTEDGMHDSDVGTSRFNRRRSGRLTVVEHTDRR